MPTVIEVPPPERMPAVQAWLWMLGGNLIALPWFVFTAQWIYVAVVVAADVAWLFRRRLRHAADEKRINRIDVADTVIRAVNAKNTGETLRRNLGGLVRVSSRDVKAHGYDVELLHAGELVGRFNVRYVDMERLREALLEHGWAFQVGADGAVEQSTVRPSPAAAQDGFVSAPEARPASSHGTRFVLRDDADGISLGSPLVWIFVVGGAAPVLAGLLLNGKGGFTLRPWMFIAWVAVVAIVFVLATYRSLARSIVIGPEQVVYHNPSGQHLARLDATTAVTLGWWYLRFVTSSGAFRVQLPGKGRRDELLALLRANGWPVRDA